MTKHFVLLSPEADTRGGGGAAGGPLHLFPTFFCFRLSKFFFSEQLALSATTTGLFHQNINEFLQ